jgi:hypothetical protein
MVRAVFAGPGCALCSAVLVVGVYARERQALQFLGAIVVPQVCREYAVVTVVVRNRHSMLPRILLKCLLRFHHVHGRRGLLEVDVRQVRGVVHENGGGLVPGLRQGARHLRDQTRCRGFHLVHRYHLPGSGGRWSLFPVHRMSAAPRPASRVAVKASHAHWDRTVGKPLGYGAVSRHGLYAMRGDVVVLMVIT